MNTINYIIENLILGMRDGKDPTEFINEPNFKQYITDSTMPVMAKKDAIELAEHIVELYDGKLPIDHLEVGDICIDAFHCSPCIVTNINDHSIHVLYFNGKTHKFKRYQEGQFKKIGSNLNFKDKLYLLMDDCSLMYKCDMELKRGPGYDYPEQKRRENDE